MKQSTANLLKLVAPQVSTAIRSVDLFEHEYDEVARMIVLAADLYLANDLRYDKCLTEIKWDRDEMTGYLDLVLVDPVHPCKIVDWKTTSNVDRPGHSDEVKNDHQTNLYLGPGALWLEENLGYSPALMEYRSLDTRLLESIDTSITNDKSFMSGHSKSFSVERKPTHYQVALQQKVASEAMYGALRDLPLWPQRRKACYEYNDTCPFISDCNNLTAPQGFTLEQFMGAQPHSKSSQEAFLRCPEHYRRTRVRGEAGRDTNAIKKGESFHAGVAILWSEGFERKGEF